MAPEPAREPAPLALAARPARATPVLTCAVALLEASRPVQWAKNLLVCAAPLAGGVLLRPAVALDTLRSFVAFTLAAVGVYLLNDVLDVDRDRLHPVKRSRPVASGRLPMRVAVAAAVVSLLTAGTVPLAAGHPAAAAVVAGYVGLSLAYAVSLKHVPVIELAVLASGFLLRPLAGAFGTGVEPSTWFLLACGLGSATVAIGKRYAELRALGVAAVRCRPVLAHYRLHVLDLARSVTAAGTAVVYLGWALTRSGRPATVAATASAVAFAGALARYVACNRRGIGEAPEELAVRDRPLQAFGAAWLVLFLVAVSSG
jgi:decaprenyl-phosphate phosphoribosyltransferase